VSEATSAAWLSAGWATLDAQATQTPPMLMTNSNASVAPRVWAGESSEQRIGITTLMQPVPKVVRDRY